MKLRSGTLLPALIVSVGAVIMIAPYVVMISVSMKSQSAIYGDPLSLMPDFPAMIDNYYRAITLVPLWRFLWNGVVVCFVILSLQILTTVPCAYALAKIDFWGRDAALAIILVGLLVPYQIVAIPLYMSLATAGVLNTYFALIAP
ncbi:MAG: carbohydrate ABC transporter permease, partial [Microvirga sp.]